MKYTIETPDAPKVPEPTKPIRPPTVLSLAEAHIGRSAGWIPAVQELGCEIAKLIES